MTSFGQQHRLPLNHTRNYQCNHQQDYRFGQNPPVENRFLRQALLRYELLHANAVNDPNFMIDFNQQISNKTVSHKYLYLTMPPSGLGNRMNNILSGFLMALLTDRVLLINGSPYDLNLVFCQPFPNSDWVLNDIDLKVIRAMGIPKIFTGSRDKVVDLFSDNFNASKLFHIIDYTHGEQYLIPMLFLNKMFLPQLNLWFPDKNVATILSHYLFHPRDVVWKEIVNSFSLRRPGDLTVGVQVRDANTPISSHMKCLHNLVANNTHIFVISLTNYVQVVRNNFPDATVSQQNSESKEKSDIHQVHTALHDIWLLSLTDETIISPGSTFGYMAMALKGKPCLTPMNRFGVALNDSVHNGINGSRTDSCYYPASHEPCYHLFVYHRYSGPYFVGSEIYDRTIMDCEEVAGTGHYNARLVTG
jgi:hypothetical protein